MGLRDSKAKRYERYHIDVNLDNVGIKTKDGTIISEDTDNEDPLKVAKDLVKKAIDELPLSDVAEADKQAVKDKLKAKVNSAKNIDDLDQIVEWEKSTDKAKKTVKQIKDEAILTEYKEVKNKAVDELIVDNLELDVSVSWNETLKTAVLDKAKEQLKEQIGQETTVQGLNDFDVAAKAKATEVVKTVNAKVEVCNKATNSADCLDKLKEVTTLKDLEDFEYKEDDAGGDKLAKLVVYSFAYKYAESAAEAMLNFVNLDNEDRAEQEGGFIEKFGAINTKLVKGGECIPGFGQDSTDTSGKFNDKEYAQIYTSLAGAENLDAYTLGSNVYKNEFTEADSSTNSNKKDMLEDACRIAKKSEDDCTHQNILSFTLDEVRESADTSVTDDELIKCIQISGFATKSFDELHSECSAAFS